MVRTKGSLLLRLIWTKRHFGAWQARAGRSHNVVLNWLVAPFLASLKKLTQFFVSIIFLIFDQRQLSINGRGLTPKEFLLFVLGLNAIIGITTLKIGVVERIHDKFISDTIYTILSALITFVFIAIIAVATVVSARAFGERVRLESCFNSSVYFMGYFILVLNFLVAPLEIYTATTVFSMVVENKLISALVLSILHDGFALYYLMYGKLLLSKLRFISWIGIYLLSQMMLFIASFIIIMPVHFIGNVIGGFSFQLSNTISLYSPPLVIFLVAKLFFR